jgi:rSAM/selenodomain-associated transferase 1
MPTLLVFLKYPTPGRVKTRLAAHVGDQRAAELYQGWIGSVLNQIQSFRAHGRIIGFFDGGTRDDFASWLSLVDEWWPQPDGDLGERLCAGFAAAQSGGGPVAAIGTDCLELDAALLQTAFEILKDKDAVFGPARDGGYYLVGIARPLLGFFDGIPWSSHTTLEAHLSLCRKHNWSVGLLPARRDIDTWEDWLAYRDGKVYCP